MTNLQDREFREIAFKIASTGRLEFCSRKRRELGSMIICQPDG